MRNEIQFANWLVSIHIHCRHVWAMYANVQTLALANCILIVNRCKTFFKSLQTDVEANIS